jgi:hypothetical protein
MINWERGGKKRISYHLAKDVRKTAEDFCRVADVGVENPTRSLNWSVLESGSFGVSVSPPIKTSLCWSCSVL